MCNSVIFSLVDYVNAKERMVTDFEMEYFAKEVDVEIDIQMHYDAYKESYMSTEMLLSVNQ